jgi:2-polyprenyl-3-methyl-5-hydroxy-6-metoxy-1,4-benzoquinol methylase
MAERAHPDLPGFKDKWFGLKKSKYKKALFRRYQFCNEYISGKEILDIPCGTGWGTSLLRGASKVHAVDRAPDAVDYARTHFKGNGIVYSVGDMAALDFNTGSLDVVVCLEGFEHVPPEVAQNFLAEACRVLRKDGLIIMTVPILTNGKHSGNPYHLFEPSYDEIFDILAGRFRFRFFEMVQGPEGEIVYFVGTPK